MLTSRLGLIALALLVSVPYLLPWRTSPIPSFYTESWAVAFGLFASLALVSARSLPLPGASLLALTLAATILVQTLVGGNALPQIAMIYGLYLVWAALLASSSRFLAEQVGIPRLVRVLATAMAIGALLAAVSSLLQPFLGWQGYSARQGGAMGQANHFTTYLWLGLASILYLRVRGALTDVMFWAAAALLILTVVVVGQRSSLLYLLALTGIAFLRARKPAVSCLPDARRLTLSISLLFFLAQALVIWMPWLGVGDAKPPPALRAVQQFEGASIRLQLWRLGMEGIAAAPLLGNGVGSYPTLAFTHVDKIPIGENPGPAESAHNLFIDLGVEMGVPVALLVLIAAGIWLRRVGKDDAAIEASWAIGIFAILGLHSLFEYPQNYSYFLGLLAVVVGAFGSGWKFGQRLAPIALSIGLLALGSLSLWEIKRDYHLLEAALILGKHSETLPVGRAAMLRIPGDSLLSPWVATSACTSLDPLQVPVNDGFAVCHIAMRFAPMVDVVVNTSVLYWRAGDTDRAKLMLSELKRVTRDKTGRVDRLMVKLAARDARLAELVGSSPSTK